MSDYKLHRVKFIEYKPSPVNSLAIDSGGSKCALSREDGSIEVLDTKSNLFAERIIPGEDDRAVESLAWCKGRLFSGGLNGDVIEWDLERLVPKYIESSNGGPVWCLRFNHQDDLLAVACEDGSVRMFDVMSEGIFYQRCLHKQESRIMSLSWSFNDKTLVTGGCDSTIRIYDVETGRITSRMTADAVEGRKTIVWAVEILRDMTIVTGDSIGNTQFWDGNWGTQLQSFKSHEADVLSIAVSTDCKTVYSTGVDSKVVKFSLHETAKRTTWDKTFCHRPTRYDVRALALCPYPQNCIISAGVDPKLYVYSAGTTEFGKLIGEYSYLPQRMECQLSTNSNAILFHATHNLQLWQLGNSNYESASAKKLCEIKCDDVNHLVCSSVSACGKFIAYSTVRRVKLLKLDNKETLTIEKVRVRLQPLSSVMFTQDSRYMIGSTFKKCLQVVDFENTKVLNMNILEKEKVSLPFRQIITSPDSQYLCLIDSSSNCYVFTLNDENVCYETNVPNVGAQITASVFSPDSKSFIFGTSNKLLYEFDLRNETLRKLFQYKEIIRNIVFNPKVEGEMFLHCEKSFSKVIDYRTNMVEELSSEDGDPVPKKKKKKFLPNMKTYPTGNELLSFGFNESGEIVTVEISNSDVMRKLPQPLKIKRFKLT